MGTSFINFTKYVHMPEFAIVRPTFLRAAAISLWAGLTGQLFLANLAAPTIKLLMARRCAECFVLVVGRCCQLGAAVLVAAEVPKFSVAHSIVLLGRDYRQKGSTRSLRR